MSRFAMMRRRASRPLPAAPRVLIVIPTLGARRDYLEKCLASVLAQSYGRIRVVLVGPTASCAETVARNNAVEFVAQAPAGIGAAVNAGWRAHGNEAEIWGWIGDDDLLEPGAVARGVAGLLDTGAVMVFGRCRYIDDSGRPLWTARPGTFAAWNLRGGVQLVPQPGSLAVADAVREVGLVDESLKFAMDYDLFLRLQHVGRFAYLPAVLASFRWHADSLSASQSEKSTTEAHDVRRRSQRHPRLARLLEPTTMRMSKLHWHLQRRPLRLVVQGLRATVLAKLGR